MDELHPDYWEIPKPKDPLYKMKQAYRAACIKDDCESIETRQFMWHQLSMWHSAMYKNRSLVGFRWGMEEPDDGELTPVDLRTENLIESGGQTFLAKAASSPLRPTLVPHGTSFKTACKVKLADKFLYGVWRQVDAASLCQQMFDDAYTCGVGGIQVHFAKGDKVVSAESIFFDNIIIDNRECVGRAEPKTYRIRKAVHRTALESLYNKKLKATKAADEYFYQRGRGKDIEIVIEIWRRPDADGKNGYHGVVACGELLIDEVWNEKWVPLVFFHWTDRNSGFYVKGGVEQGIPYQVIQNELNETIRKVQRLTCHPNIMAPASTQFDWSQWDADNMAGVLLYHGMEPKPLTLQGNLNELYMERDRNSARYFSAMALSEMFANADMPQQVRMDSSAGMREARNMEDARHLDLWTRYEKARLRLAKALMHVIGAADDQDFTTLYRPYAATVEGSTVAWKAIKDLNEDHFSWEMAAASLAQQTPAARRETLRDWMSRGQAGQWSGSEMTTNPDLEMIERMEIASEEDIERHIQLMEEGGFEAPDEFTDLSKGMMMVRENLHRLRRYEDLGPQHKIIRNHRQWLVRAAARVAAAMPQPAQQNMAPYAPTQGVAGTSAATMQ